MDNRIGRPRAGMVYAWLMGLATLEVIVQGFLFSGFYSQGESVFLDIHGIAGEMTGYIVLVVLIPLGFLAKFPRRLQIGWFTVLLAFLWNLQGHVFGYGIEDVRWFEMVHILLAFGALLLALYLTVQARNAIMGDRRAQLEAGAGAGA